LFRGRDDVYARRWEAPDGRHGYSPVLRAGIRRVRRQPIEPAQCLPLTDEAIRGHLEGAGVLGVYPLQLDETTAFLAIDLDKAAWLTTFALSVRHARSSEFPTRWSAHAQGAARTCGCSSIA